MMSEYNLNVANDSMLEINGAVDGLRRIKEVASDAQARAADSLVKPAKTLVKIVHDQRMAVSRKVDALKKQLIAKENEICSELNAEIERVSGLCGAYMNAKLAEKAYYDYERRLMRRRVEPRPRRRQQRSPRSRVGRSLPSSSTKPRSESP